MRKSKKLDKFLTREIIKEAIVSDEGLLERFKFEKRVPSVKTLVLSICYSILLIVITSLTTIFIYSKINNNQYGGDQIIYEALEAFDEELDRKYTKKNFFQVDFNNVIATYYCEFSNEYVVVCYSTAYMNAEVRISINNAEYIIDNVIEVYDIIFLENNELILYFNDEVIFSATF